MRPTTPTLGRALVGAVLLSVGAACADQVTQPGGPGAARAPRFDVVDSAVADTTTAPTTTVSDTTVVVAGSELAPQLLACPTTDAQSASAVIGPDGGSVTARGATLTIPAGAVPEPTLFEVVVPASPYVEADIHAVGVDHYVFQSPVTITINYARCPSSAIPAGARFQGVYVDTSTYQILQQMGGVTYKSSHKVSFSTGHLSGYIIAY